MWHEGTHKITKKGKEYFYPTIKAAVRVNGKHKTFMRTYGGKRTKAEAIKLVVAWYNAQPKYIKLADRNN